MKETQFKALMYCGEYVNANLLEKGIYACDKPFIYHNDETIDTLIQRGKNIKDMTGASFMPEIYFDNLRMCQLITIFITETKPSYFVIFRMNLNRMFSSIARFFSNLLSSKCPTCGKGRVRYSYTDYIGCTSIDVYECNKCNEEFI